jgi:hypothetical protein
MNEAQTAAIAEQPTIADFARTFRRIQAENRQDYPGEDARAGSES